MEFSHEFTQRNAKKKIKGKGRNKERKIIKLAVSFLPFHFYHFSLKQYL